MKIWKQSVLFYLGGMLYAALELLWRGWTHGSMFALGGLCFVTVGQLGQSRLPLPFKVLGRIYFRKNKKPEWFEDDFVKEFILAIDKATVLFEEALKDRWGHGISVDKISTGSKSLCCIYYDDKETIFNGSQMGDNCVPFLMRIAEYKDVTIMLEHYMLFSDDDLANGKIKVDGKIIHSVEEYEYAFSDYCVANEEYYNRVYGDDEEEK